MRGNTAVRQGQMRIAVHSYGDERDTSRQRLHHVYNKTWTPPSLHHHLTSMPPGPGSKRLRHAGPDLACVLISTALSLPHITSLYVRYSFPPNVMGLMAPRNISDSASDTVSRRWEERFARGRKNCVSAC